MELEKKDKNTIISNGQKWLLCLVIMISANSLLSIVYGAAMLNEALAYFDFIIFITILIVAFYGLFATTLILKNRASAVGHARRWMNASLICNLLIAIETYYLLGNTVALISISVLAVIYFKYMIIVLRKLQQSGRYLLR